MIDYEWNVIRKYNHPKEGGKRQDKNERKKRRHETYTGNTYVNGDNGVPTSVCVDIRHPTDDNSQAPIIEPPQLNHCALLEPTKATNIRNLLDINNPFLFDARLLSLAFGSHTYSYISHISNISLVVPFPADFAISVICFVFFFNFFFYIRASGTVSHCTFVIWFWRLMSEDGRFLAVQYSQFASYTRHADRICVSLPI